MSENKKTVSFPVAVMTLLVVAGIMSLGLAILKLNTMVTFILTFLAVCGIALCVGTKLNQLEDMILAGFRKTAQVCMIFIAVGMVVGSWIISGIVPSIIYYGLKIFTPASFLALGFLVCCIVSFFTGSSYAALGTMGIAFMAIGYGMGINPALVAGMSVSGAVFGDKMSPFSDTTTWLPPLPAPMSSPTSSPCCGPSSPHSLFLWFCTSFWACVTPTPAPMLCRI